MGIVIHHDPLPLGVDVTGTVRVGGTRVVLDRVVHAFRDGATPEQIAQDFDVLDLADVYGTIAYYLRHRDEIDAYLAERSRAADDLRKTIEAEQSHLPDIRARIVASRTKREAS